MRIRDSFQTCEEVDLGLESCFPKWYKVFCPLACSQFSPLKVAHCRLNETGRRKMSITLRCTSCSRKLSIPDAWAGMRGKCPYCFQILDIPKCTVENTHPTYQEHVHEGREEDCPPEAPRDNTEQHCEGLVEGSANRGAMASEPSSVPDLRACPPLPTDLSIGKQVVNWGGDAAFAGYYNSEENGTPSIASGKTHVLLHKKGINLTGPWRQSFLQIHSLQVIHLYPSFPKVR